MKKLQILMLSSMILTTYSTVSSSMQSKAAQIQAKAASLKTKITSASASRPTPATLPASTHAAPAAAKSPQNVSAQSSPYIKQLIDELIKAVAKITCSCKSHPKKEKSNVEKNKKSSSSQSADAEENLPHCKHDKDHNDTLQAAFEVYKKLHDAMKDGCLQEDDIQRVTPAVHKLFECKNIQMMPFFPKKCNSAPSAPSAPRTKTTQPQAPVSTAPTTKPTAPVTVPAIPAAPANIPAAVK